EIMNRGSLLIATVPDACKGAVFARSAALPAPPQWNLATPEPALAAAVEREIAGDFRYQDILEGASGVGYGTLAPTLMAVNPPGTGKRFAAAWLEGPLDCHKDGFAITIWEVKGSRDRPV